MNATHNNILITYNEDKNTWEFQLRGRERSASSLAKAKEAIDKPAPEKVKPFERIECYRMDWRCDAERVTVTSVAEDRGFGNSYLWTIDAKKNRSKESANNLYPCNEKNDALVAEIKRLDTEAAKLRAQRDKVKEKLKCLDVPREPEGQ